MPAVMRYQIPKGGNSMVGTDFRKNEEQLEQDMGQARGSFEVERAGSSH